MLTLKLWRALNHPPLRSPLFRRVYFRQQPVHLSDFHVPLFGLFKNVSLIILPVILILLGAPLLVLLYYLALLIAPLLLPLANTIYGIAQAADASGAIVRERERQTYDVLCLLPPGSLGMHWSYATGWIHYHWPYRYALLGVLSVGIVASVFGLSPQVVFGSGASSIVTTIVRALVLGTIFVLDYTQSIVLSSLITLIVPTRAQTETDARLWAVSLFLVLQLAVYVPTLLLTVFALPGFFALMGIDHLLADLLIPPLILAFFAALRELIITGLWHTIEQELSTSTVELDAITRLAL